MLQSVKTFVAAKFSAAIPTADRPSALAAFADSSAAPPTPSASGAAPPSPPERMAAGSDSSEARHGRISPCAANPGASVRNGDKCSASPDPTGEREQPSPAAPASPPALAIAPWRAVRSQAEQRRWQHQEARRRLGSGATHAALRVCINEIRAEPLPPPPSRRARGRRGGAKQRSRAAPRSDHVSTPSVPQRAPAITGHQHAAEASAGLGRAALRALNVLQARDAAWQQRVRARRAAAAARLPPRNAHVSAWRIRAAALALQAGEARFRAVEEVARAALRCAETARDDILQLCSSLNLTYAALDLASGKLHARVDKIYQETGQLNKRLGGLEHADLDERLRDLEHADLNRRLRNLEHDGRRRPPDICDDLKELGARLKELEPLRVPISWVVAAEAELDALDAKRDTFEEEGWSWRYGAEGRAPVNKSDLHDLTFEMYGELLGIRRDLLGLRPRGNGVR
eukprot:CAMPEP_0180184922 /NCGR_PEP_ID=MMETSP0986-20121125/42109_1 /TAXON_ID=697907 /ORGANISM="non described non described, Strain CCMP2293" /LENGTH=457 /DNA_ID=CAMNT_0022138693 /DNA_START=26 /DNA_END=1399 /DNA_ORIENTATION=-